MQFHFQLSQSVSQGRMQMDRSNALLYRAYIQCVYNIYMCVYLCVCSSTYYVVLCHCIMQSNRTVTPHNFYMDIIEMQFLAHIPGELYLRCQIFHALTVIIISHFYLTDCTIIASFIVVIWIFLSVFFSFCFALTII